MNLGLFDSFTLNIWMSFGIIFVTLYYLMSKNYEYWKRRNVKYVKPVPLFGNLMSIILRKKSNPIDQLENYSLFPKERYLGIFYFLSPWLMIRDPQLINHILIKDFTHFYDRGTVYDERVDLLHLHLLNLKGQKWKSLRNKLSPAFSSGKLKSMSYLLEDCVNALADYLETLSLSSTPQNISAVMAKFSMNVVGSCFFGLQFNCFSGADPLFYKMGTRCSKPTLKYLLREMARGIHPSLIYYFNLKMFDKDAEQFFLDFAIDAINRREDNKSEKKDLIQLLVELRNEDLTAANHESEEDSFVLTDQVLASNVFIFFLAGYETTSITMSFLLMELAAHPDIQKRTRQEIVEALKKHNGELDYSTITNLAYLEMVISETLRKYPVAQGTLRECNKTYHVPESDLVIEEGIKVIIPIFALQHDPNYFPDPERFDPERFSPENKHKILKGTYMPFGDGPRICIGLRFAALEIKYALCKILPKYEFSLGEGMKYPVELSKNLAALMVPEGGVLLNLHRID